MKISEFEFMVACQHAINSIQRDNDDAITTIDSVADWSDIVIENRAQWERAIEAALKTMNIQVVRA